ncbi:MAG: HEAT repeat domain-containing protein [Bacteroidales bacterium]|nr:HEAT repeat domain-containing protein [Bacteroidales bacterium]
MPDYKALQRKKRGQINDEDLNVFTHFSEKELLDCLSSGDSITRTCAATIIGNRKSITSIPDLCKALKIEKALYPKIAISEALGEIGEPAIPFLIDMLGEIGNNQHKKLPDKSFEKWNYPLPRDIVARTIVKIGQTALPQLIDSLDRLNEKQITEAIDAIGFISFYSQDKTAWKALLQLLDLYKLNKIIVWKIIRSLQSFHELEVEQVLESQVLFNPEPAIRWEAIRSLTQITASSAPDCFCLAEKDNDARVKHAVKIARKRLLLKSL